MKMQQYTVLARRCQSGDVAARKKLLMESYMWISYQCRHILLNQSSAETITRDILHTLHKKLDEMETPGQLDAARSSAVCFSHTILPIMKISQLKSSWEIYFVWGYIFSGAVKPSRWMQVSRMFLARPMREI